jgi:hypothetical protein
MDGVRCSFGKRVKPWGGVIHMNDVAAIRPISQTRAFEVCAIVRN